MRLMEAMDPETGEKHYIEIDTTPSANIQFGSNGRFSLALAPEDMEQLIAKLEEEMYCAIAALQIQLSYSIEGYEKAHGSKPFGRSTWRFEAWRQVQASTMTRTFELLDRDYESALRIAKGRAVAFGATHMRLKP
jgi:hypothetical protein